MSIRPLLASVGILLVLPIAFSQTPEGGNAPRGQDAASNDSEGSDRQSVSPRAVLGPVPDLLRLHLPMLDADHGVVAESVPPGSTAAKLGIREGDILFEAGGKLVREGTSLDGIDASLPVVVIRRGRTRVLHPAIDDEAFEMELSGRLPRWMSRSLFRDVKPPRGLNRGPGVGPDVGPKVGPDREPLRSPKPDNGDASKQQTDGPLSFSGTADRIEQQLESGRVPDSVKDSIRRMLRQKR